MLVGYMRVSKVDGSQVSDLQRDALLAAGVDAQPAIPGVEFSPAQSVGFVVRLRKLLLGSTSPHPLS
jgi:hypothetical protein